MKSHEFIRENTDDELFGSDADGTKAIVYRTGKKMLTRLENTKIGSLTTYKILRA